MALFTDAEFAAYLQQSLADLDAAAVTLLHDLTAGLVGEVTGVDYTDPAVVPGVQARAVGLEAAARAYRNPQGVAAETVGGETYRYDDDGELGVYLTRDERERLRGLPASGAFTIRAQPVP
jgi:hypothetical protein